MTKRTLFCYVGRKGRDTQYAAEEVAKKSVESLIGENGRQAYLKPTVVTSLFLIKIGRHFETPTYIPLLRTSFNAYIFCRVHLSSCLRSSTLDWIRSCNFQVYNLDREWRLWWASRAGEAFISSLLHGLKDWFPIPLMAGEYGISLRQGTLHTLSSLRILCIWLGRIKQSTLTALNSFLYLMLNQIITPAVINAIAATYCSTLKKSIVKKLICMPNSCSKVAWRIARHLLAAKKIQSSLWLLVSGTIMPYYITISFHKQCE